MSDEYSLYGGAATFMHFESCGDPASSDADILIVGVPFDLATTGRAGTRSGPWAIRQASAHLAWEKPRWPWGFALADRLRVADCGDLNVPTGDPAALSLQLTEFATNCLAAGKSLLALGGDHYIALPLLRAYAARYGPLALIHFDAHSDTASDGGEYDHGNMFRVALEEGLIDAAASVQVGIRSHYDRENHRLAVLDAAWVNEGSPGRVLEKIHAIVGDRAAYLTFDIDCLDPAHAPGTGTPVAGGMTTDMALRLIRGLGPARLVGMDLVEVAPGYDHAEITALAAASIALDYLYLRGS